MLQSRFQISDRVKVLVQLLLIANSEFTFERLRSRSNRVENAAAAAESVEVRFDMATVQVGTMRLQFAALSNGGRDATELSLPVHQIMLAVNGIHILERLRLEELVEREVYEFAFVMQPLRIRGATGSTVAGRRPNFEGYWHPA